MSNDPETRPSVGKDVSQDRRGSNPPPAPDNMGPSSNLGNPDPGYADQKTMNEQNPGQQQNRGERPRVQQEQDESVRKAEIKKAVEEDDPDNNPRGQEKTGFSGGT
ncbi:hypothetical protein Nham_4625 (plasmid) [Nitrobacter hamburgensis X14]|uniref:Uncharacterized protein n=1 Tax=Nitrobacter hamburgensis (strain DSM 10229 / NCIMB 13809 / X14) TaxID=323097 RepID=Q1QF11_NITHX|nr:hypothetical protein [Nitrobacter hamburgensis]ABE65186.1 hypothetical protein Nham_4625 [Nitrobacter hamburgensis X14]